MPPFTSLKVAKIVTAEHIAPSPRSMPFTAARYDISSSGSVQIVSFPCNLKIQSLKLGIQQLTRYLDRGSNKRKMTGLKSEFSIEMDDGGDNDRKFAALESEGSRLHDTTRFDKMKEFSLGQLSNVRPQKLVMDAVLTTGVGTTFGIGGIHRHYYLS
jgi:hypothetical protein